VTNEKKTNASHFKVLGFSYTEIAVKCQQNECFDCHKRTITMTLSYNTNDRPIMCNKTVSVANNELSILLSVRMF